MTNEVNAIAAFGAGFLSFISPCVLPLVPAYISYISGVSLESLKGQTAVKKAGTAVIINTLLFVGGFTLVFSLLGASATYIGKYLVLYKTYINIAGGVLVIILGLHLASIFRIPFLDYEKRFHPEGKPLGLLSSFLIGSAFAFGWTPCIGPILSGILLLAANQQTIGGGLMLLVIYSAGLGVPFLLTGIALNYALGVFKAIKRHYRKIELASGLLLIVIGFMVATDQFTRLSSWLARLSGEGI